MATETEQLREENAKLREKLANYKKAVRDSDAQLRSLRIQVQLALRNPEKFKNSSCLSKRGYQPKEAARKAKQLGQSHYKCYVCTLHHLTSKPFIEGDTP